jgi:hypothetical protein
VPIGAIRGRLSFVERRRRTPHARRLVFVEHSEYADSISPETKTTDMTPVPFIFVGAGSSLIYRSNGRTFVISSVQPKSIWGMSVNIEPVPFSFPPFSFP